ncbi:MAG: LysR family transcriptional regulator [Pseudomonadota bacterium]
MSNAMVPKRNEIELRHLRCFLAAAEHASFRRAGTALGIQASSVSRRIRDLEDQLGVSLFQRHNGGVRLTVAGEKFKARARAIIEQVSEGVVDNSVIGCGVDGRIRIGLVATASFELFWRACSTI